MDDCYHCPNCDGEVPYEILEGDHCDECFTDSDVQHQCKYCGVDIDKQIICNPTKLPSYQVVPEWICESCCSGDADGRIKESINEEFKDDLSKLERERWKKRFLDDFKEDSKY
ncbi:hypothetical protein OAJ67_01540 [Candidatus Nitrosopelagicus sp.]|nr:hypothetical protein [Candidatus Nitrosopelagicus sp.]